MVALPRRISSCGRVEGTTEKKKRERERERERRVEDRGRRGFEREGRSGEG